MILKTQERELSFFRVRTCDRSIAAVVFFLSRYDFTTSESLENCCSIPFKKNNHKKVALVMMTSVFARSYSQLSLHPSSHLCCLHHYRMYCNCTGPGFALHSDIVMPYIVNYGSKEQIKHFIPKMTAGKCIAAIAMTEPGAGRSGLNHRL